MRNRLEGTPPTGASVTSGTISTTTALGAGDVTINTVALPAMTAAADAAARCDQMVAAINSVQSQTGLLAEKLTSVTFKILGSENIVIAALAGAATAANTGLTAGTTTLGARTLLDTRAAFGTAPSGTEADTVKWGSMEIPVHHAEEMGMLFYDGATIRETRPAQTATRTNA